MAVFENTKRNKIAVVGSGMIGGTLAFLSSLGELGDVVLFDRSHNKALSKALDLCHTSSVIDNNITAFGSDNYRCLQDADVVIITSGVSKIPGKTNMTRKDLLLPNVKIMREIGEAIKTYCPNAFIITITNPLDIMVNVLKDTTQLPSSRICGMSGMLDSSRFRGMIANKLSVSPRDVQGMVIGVHGDNMLPLVRYATVNGIPLEECIRQGWITKKEMEDIVEKTKTVGYTILHLSGETTSAFYSPSTAAIAMAEAYLNDQKRVMVCSCYLEGQYGAQNHALGVPCVLGSNGIERIIELELNDKEKKAFQGSINEVKEMLKEVAEFDGERQQSEEGKTKTL